MQKDANCQKALIKMPIKATPYQHQINAFNFVCKLFGLVEGGELDDRDMQIAHKNYSEMIAGKR